MSQIEVKKRRNYLINGLRKLGIYHTDDGRKLENCSLYTLEWTNISVRFEMANSI